MDIKTLTQNLFFIGIVTDLLPEKGMAVVKMPDHDDKPTAPLFVLQRGTFETKHYWMPAIDEQVLCVRTPNFAGKGMGEGFIVGAIYSKEDTPVEDDAKVRSVVWPDGCFIRYKEGEIFIHAVKAINLTVVNEEENAETTLRLTTAGVEGETSKAAVRLTAIDKIAGNKTVANFATPNKEDDVDAGINLTSAGEKGSARIRITVPDPAREVNSWIGLEAEKITLSSKKKIELTAGELIKLDSKKDIEEKAVNTVTIKGEKVNIN